MKFVLFVLAIIAIANVRCEYNEEEATELYNHCRISYCSYDRIEHLNDCGPICDKFKTYMEDTTLVIDEPNHIFAYLFYHKFNQHIHVIYRGTQGNLNWLNNFDAKKTAYPECSNCEVHEGFYKYHNIIIAKIKPELEKLSNKYGTRKVYVSGHSLGGALATLGAAEISKTYDVDLIITYGSPRVGNKEFSEWWTNSGLVGEHYRIVQYEDIVPHVPVELMGYQHVGTEVWYTADGSLAHKICPKLDDPKCSDSIHWLKPYDHGKYMGIDWTTDPIFGPCVGFPKKKSENSIVEDRLFGEKYE